MFNFEIDHVYIDSDGVICSFDSRAVEILGGRQINEVPKGLFWAKVEQYDKNVQPFFETLDIMPNAEILVQFAVANFKKVSILTASGFTPKDGKAQKHRWYAQHFPELNVICVDKSPDKAAYASPTAILIDDRQKSIQPWIAAGGIGILHTSVESTIAQLKKYI